MDEKRPFLSLLLLDEGGDDVSMGGRNMDVESPLSSECFSAVLKKKTT